MSKPYAVLRERMKPAARKKAAEKTKTLLDAMPLQELRHARSLSQERGRPSVIHIYRANPSLQNEKYFLPV